MIKEISKELRIVLSKNQDEGLYSIMKMLYDYAQEPGININDVINEMAGILDEIENYEPDPNDLRNSDGFYF